MEDLTTTNEAANRSTKVVALLDACGLAIDGNTLLISTVDQVARVFLADAGSLSKKAWQ